MSDIQQKLSLLDAINNNRLGKFYLYNVAELIINDIFMPISRQAYLMIFTTDNHVQIDILENDKKIFFFELENEKVRDFHIILNQEER